MKKIILCLVSIAFLYSQSSASTLRIGTSASVQSMDPYFINNDDTNSVLSNIFDNLIRFDKDLKIKPNLALSWKNPTPKEWVLTLRKGVKFHNGSSFNADDVIFSYKRVKNWKKSSFKSKINMIEKIEKIDDYTVKMTTTKPYPIFLRQLTYISILDKETLSAKSDQWVGLNPVGTGPYKLTSWSKGSNLNLAVNKNYFMGIAKYDKVIFKPLTNDATRIAGLLSGAVDIVNKVSVVDVARIKNNNKLNFFMIPSLKTIYIHLDQHRLKSKFIKSKKGQNPLLDKRVRMAFSYAINRESITKHIMKNFAITASQLNASTVNGYDLKAKPLEYNPKKARKLLADAGYKNGFEIQLDTLNNGDFPKVAQAVASSLARVGIKVKVNAAPGSVYFSKMSKRDTSFSLIGWSSGSGDASSFYDSIVHSVKPKKGYGKYNWGNFSNLKVDNLIESSASTMDAKRRTKQLKNINKIAMSEVGFLPLYYTVNLYASSKKIKFTPRTDSYIWAFDIK